MMVRGDPKTWNFGVLLVAILIGVSGQAILLPCLCSIGRVKMTFAGLFSAMIVCRTVVAYWRKEKGNGWIFYSVLIATSPAWIEGGTWLAFGDT
jgi:hypothetical protein